MLSTFDSGCVDIMDQDYDTSDLKSGNAEENSEKALDDRGTSDSNGDE